jgi:tRNA-dihydrouridine synthase
MFAGKADWDEIALLVERLDIPVVGNGDVDTAADVVAMQRHTGCAGIMIARGSFGNPWIFAQGRALLDGVAQPDPPTAQERWATALEHARLAREKQGDTRTTALEFRKHLGWYTRGIEGAAALRARLFRITSLADAERILTTLLETEEVEAVA